MHIGIFTDCYTPQVNGVVTSVKILEQELRNLGHKVTVVTVRVPGYEDDQDNIIRIPSVPFIRWSEFRVGIPLGYDTYRKLNGLGLDLIHTHTEFTLGFVGKYLASHLNIPIIHTYHTMYEDYTHYVFDHKYGKRMVKKLITTGSRFYVRKYDSIIAPSAKTLAALRGYGVRNTIEVVPTGIDISKFQHNHDEADCMALRKRYGLKATDYVMLSLGRISKEKSVDAIIAQMPRILKFIPEAKLLIVGDGPYRAELEKYVDSLGVRSSVIFAGQVAFEEVGLYYSSADIFVNASQSETQGLTIIEAMASKLPVVVYDDLNVEGIVVKGASGRLYKEEADLGNQVILAYNNTEETSSMTEAAFQVVLGLSKEKFAHRIEDVYAEVLDRPMVTIM